MLHPMAKSQFVLASGSPRRLELLRRIGIEPEVIVSGVDEDQFPGLSPHQLVTRLSKEKAAAVAAQNPDAWVIAGDTIVVCRGEIFGKPVDEDDARRMLLELSGSVHQVIGGLALVHRAAGVEEVRAVVTEVEFIKLTERMIRGYIDSKEPFDKAGSYAMQDVGGSFVKRINGSPTNVIGLDIPTVLELTMQYNLLG